MERIPQKSVGASIFNVSPPKLDGYIKECMHCAHTCRICADNGARNASKFSEIIDVCLECAKTCESLARGLLLHKQGVKNVRQFQIEATIAACRVCASRCEQRAKECDCIDVCVKSVRHCEDIVKTLLPKPSRPKSVKIFTFFKTVVGR